MDNKYIPPYQITDEMINLVAQIMENLGKLNNVNQLENLPRLRKVSKIMSIHSSLAIENNTLTVQQVTDVIDGKKVMGPSNDIKAVKNANQAYAQMEDINPYNLNDLLKIHGIMMKDLVSQAGKIRTGQVGVYNQNGEVIHLAPPAEFVPDQIEKLFVWLKESQTNVIIKSCVFHYEFEFIHPFQDGNGRMGRYWQTAILSNWKPIFKWIPIENIIKENQQNYYKSIGNSTSEGKANHFILFMLNVINSAILQLSINAKNHINHMNNQISQLLQVVETYPQSANELMKKLNLKSRDNFRKNYLNPAIQSGLVQKTMPNAPTSKNQKYFKL